MASRSRRGAPVTLGLLLLTCHDRPSVFSHDSSFASLIFPFGSLLGVRSKICSVPEICHLHWYYGAFQLCPRSEKGNFANQRPLLLLWFAQSPGLLPFIHIAWKNNIPKPARYQNIDSVEATSLPGFLFFDAVPSRPQ